MGISRDWLEHFSFGHFFVFVIYFILLLFFLHKKYGIQNGKRQFFSWFCQCDSSYTFYILMFIKVLLLVSPSTQRKK